MRQVRRAFSAQENRARKMHEFKAFSKFPVLLITGHRTVIAEHTFQMFGKCPGKCSKKTEWK
jgi:hypothetical protein